MSDGWGSIASLLGLRNQRKQANRDRISGSVRDIASMIYGRKEREAGEAFSAGESELDRESRAGLTEAQLENNRLLQEMSGGQALEQIGAGGEEARLTQAAGAEQAGVLADQNNEARTALQTQIDDAAMARLDAQISAEETAMDALWRQRSAQYDDLQSLYSPSTGKTYTWQTEEEFELRKAEIEGDIYREALRLQAALSDTDPDAQSRIIEGYEFAKNEVLNPSVLNPETGAWQSMAEITPEALEQQFRDAIALHNLTPEEVEKAVVLFRGFIEKIPDVVPDPEADATRLPSLTNIPLGEGTVASDVQELGPLGTAAAPMVTLAERVFPNLYPQTTAVEREETGMPEGVMAADVTHARRDEMDPWRQLQALLQAFTSAQTPAEQQQARTYQAQLEEPGFSKVNELRAIQEFIERFKHLLPDESSVAPQGGDQLSYVNNMLSRMG